MIEPATPIVGFIGLGKMGQPMVRRLAAVGRTVVVHDISPAAVAELAKVDGVEAADSVADVASRSEILVLMLPNSDLVERVLVEQGAFTALAAGLLVVGMGSSEPARTKSLALVAKTHSIDLIDAPVSGGVRGAEKGTLTVMVGGAAAVVERARPILASVGSRVTHTGDVGSAHALKAINNLMSATHLLVSSEALLGGAAFGLDTQVMLDVINASSGRSGSTDNKWPNFVLTGTYDSGFGLSLMLKDMRIALGLIKDAGVPAALSEASVELWAQAERELPPDADHTEIARWLRT